MMKRIGLISLIILMTLFAGRSGSSRAATEVSYMDNAAALLSSMSPAERVGQLFLVTFTGNTVATKSDIIAADSNIVAADSDIATLILDYKVGGVALLAENDNFSNASPLPGQIASLTRDLQQLALLGQILPTPPDPIDDTLPPTPIPEPADASVPLFIAVSHAGGGLPDTEIRSGLTPIPSQMAIGATWQPEFARAVGEIVGAELSTMGINMLLGPSLDVLEKPAPASPNDLGDSVFGGDPYWVGQMGKAYIAGVHAGSRNRIAVIATHFPGNGSSDRPIDEEVSTVRKSLEQLKQIELAPFFAVTDAATPPESRANGLLTTHIRYQGFQGNIRATTAPISFDLQALTTLLQLPQFASWRATEGLMVSDRLGVGAVRRFYDDTEREFPHRRIAKDALLAGNDLLFLAQFSLVDNDYAQQLANIKDTITWFQERYEMDPSFQQRVDQAATRVLATKLKLYNNNFSLENVLPVVENVPTQFQTNQTRMFELAQQAVTLISPSQEELSARLPTPPTSSDNIVIFTDVRQMQQCRQCPLEPYISQTALQERMLALYGPQASGQVRPDQINSFSFADLNAFLSAGLTPIPAPTVPFTSTVEGESTPTPTPPDPAFQVQEALRRANWIIFALLDRNADVPNANALNAFLARRPDISRNANTIVFAFEAPYYLDTTEISKLTAYYGIYSKTGPFLDAAVRVLFQEIPARGHSPVTIEGVGYDLFTVTQPDANQVIQLFIVSDGSVQSPPNEAPQEMMVGQTLRLQTGIIVDQNGYPVPDGTLVEFIQLDRINGFVSVIAQRPTVNGAASLDYILEARTGQFRITAAAGAAHTSLEVDIAIGDNVRVVVITPTPAPTAVPTNTPPPTATATATTTVSPTPAVTPTLSAAESEPGLLIPLAKVSMLLSLMAGIGLLVAAGIFIGYNRDLPPTQLLQFVLWGIIGGLLAYLYFSLNLPGSARLQPLGAWAAIITTASGGAVGMLLCWGREEGRRS
ncbi:MAG: hypothetical protein Fur0021_28230 [Candidatus Promineifilaceae bacterium]